MPDNRSLWSDGPSEDEHHGWLDAEKQPAPAGRPLSSDHAPATKVHRAEDRTPPLPVGDRPAPPRREGPSAWATFVGAMRWPIVALCVAALLVGGIAIGTRFADTKTVERTVVSGNGGSPGQIKAAYEVAHEGVVRIETGDAIGSGWVYDDKGTIVTNNHVVSDAGKGGTVQVRFKDDGGLTPAKVLGTDISSDLAVLRVDPKDAPKLVPLKIAESDDVQTGDPVIAIGYPLGQDQTTTAGIISGVGREIPAQNNFQIEKVLQTDAPINRGNSGGPLLNTKGEVVGVNSQIQTTGTSGGSIGIGFAIPSDTVRDAVPTLEQGRAVPHPYLGVQVGPLRSGDGAMVGGVTAGSPASRAGLRVNSDGAQRGLAEPDGDVIVKIDGKDVVQPSDVTSTVNEKKPGDRITLEVRLKGKTRSVDVTLGNRPESSQTAPTQSMPTSPSSPSNPLNPSIP
ncbi:S1C family serine protease [Patulibacter minatonensis]|uniref:S1C family serine protease n=1 Tax=Patulibacter minatonensis TaxID=298163 RepID=UPI0004B9E392|nr:trypsin-like peptidase domain-containing protein [Patulibacter minatonensis]